MAVTSTDDVLAQDTAIPAARSISTTAPLAGGGDLSADRTLTLTTSPASQTPVGVTRSLATTAPITGGGDLSADRTIAISDLVGDAGAGGTKGAVPAPGAGDTAAGKFLKADATWAVPAVLSAVSGANGSTQNVAVIEELLTLDTGAGFTDSVGDLLPANSLILCVTARVTTSITTATAWKLGDATTTGRFAADNATMTAGATSIGFAHLQGAVSTDAAGPVQTAAAKLRVTTTGTPGAGAVRLSVYYLQGVASTS